jgi:hypothetical protein
MDEAKTKPTRASVASYLNAIEGAERLVARSVADIRRRDPKAQRSLPHSA